MKRNLNSITYQATFETINWHSGVKNSKITNKLTVPDTSNILNNIETVTGHCMHTHLHVVTSKKKIIHKFWKGIVAKI